VCQAIINFLNICVEQAEIPEVWEHAFLHVLYKGKAPVDDANNYRGITLKSQLLIGKPFVLAFTCFCRSESFTSRGTDRLSGRQANYEAITAAER
jgi:hypothetical protein